MRGRTTWIGVVGALAATIWMAESGVGLAASLEPARSVAPASAQTQSTPHLTPGLRLPAGLAALPTVHMPKPWPGVYYVHAQALRIRANGDCDMEYSIYNYTPSGETAWFKTKLRVVAVAGRSAKAVVTASDDPRNPVGTVRFLLRRSPGILIPNYFQDGTSAKFCDEAHAANQGCGA